MLVEGQNEFRKKRGTLDNVYVLPEVIDYNKRKKRDGMLWVSWT